MTMRRLEFLTLAAGAGLAVNGVADAAPVYGRQSTIGVSAPLSGTYGAFGEQIVAGVQAAIGAYNRVAMQMTGTFGIRALDDSDRGVLAVSNAQIFSGDPSIVAVIGSLTQETTLAMLPQCDNLGLTCMVPTVTRDALTRRGYRSVFRLATPDSAAGRLSAHRIDMNLHPKSVIVLARDDGYGLDLARAYAAQSKADHVATTLTLLPRTQVPDAVPAQQVLATTPDIIYVAGTSADLGPLLPMLAQAGFKGRFVLSDGFYDMQSLKLYAPQLADAWVATPMPPLDRISGSNIDFQYLQASAGSVSAISAFAYAAAQIVISVASRLGAVSRFAVLQGMRTTGSFNTLVGPYSFDVNGDPIDPNEYFYKAAGGRFVYRTAARPSTAFF